MQVTIQSANQKKKTTLILIDLLDSKLLLKPTLYKLSGAFKFNPKPVRSVPRASIVKSGSLIRITCSKPNKPNLSAPVTAAAAGRGLVASAAALPVLLVSLLFCAAADGLSVSAAAAASAAAAPPNAGKSLSF